MHLLDYLNDGASFKAKAVLAIVQTLVIDHAISKTWQVTRWENGQDQGYTVFNKPYHQLNITFFEDVSESIIVFTWSTETDNSPTLSDLKIDSLSTKDLPSVVFGKYSFKKAAEHIIELMDEFG